MGVSAFLLSSPLSLSLSSPSSPSLSVGRGDFSRGDHPYRAIPKPVVSKVQLHPQALALIRDEESVTDTTNDEQDLVES